MASRPHHHAIEGLLYPRPGEVNENGMMRTDDPFCTERVDTLICYICSDIVQTTVVGTAMTPPEVTLPRVLKWRKKMGKADMLGAGKPIATWLLLGCYLVAT